ncbi:hypothetical protein [Nesterenkonia ebinurensis]|uniref:hypothetical protein n=1 Tax=Nesterenkonia ebinurensis TaxID=2608252 RepID=UPI00123DEAC7|nr:hypothetical protein [Nesterenkonia ebinurensis]
MNREAVHAAARGWTAALGVFALMLSAGCGQEPVPAPPAAQEIPDEELPETEETETAEPTEEEDDGRYRLDERPDFAELESRVRELYDEYYLAYGDDTIYELTPADDSYLGEYYAWAFVTEIGNHYTEMLDADQLTSEDPDELDEQIEQTLEQLDELEVRFTDGQLLNVPAEDPEDWYEYDDRHPDFYEWEEQAASYAPELDNESTYWTAGEELAEIFNLEVVDDFDEVVCLETHDNTRDTGYYCEATPEAIYLNPDHIYFADYVRDVWWYELVRHEIAHHQIHMKCGSVAPPIVGDMVEAVTSSYAVLFLGADRDTLEWGEEPGSEYIMTDESFEIAEAIAEEYCFELP